MTPIAWNAVCKIFMPTASFDNWVCRCINGTAYTFQCIICFTNQHSRSSIGPYALQIYQPILLMRWPVFTKGIGLTPRDSASAISTNEMKSVHYGLAQQLKRVLVAVLGSLEFHTASKSVFTHSKSTHGIPWDCSAESSACFCPCCCNMAKELSSFSS